MSVMLTGPTACAAVPDAVEVQTETAEVEMNVAFDQLMRDLAARVDARLKVGIPVPLPVDAGGGYTHEQHKQNGKTIYEAGLLYTYFNDARYLDAVRDILLDYAEIYPDLGLHPQQKEQTPGRLFWQSLNESEIGRASCRERV